MRINVFQWSSIKARVILFTLVIFMVSIWSLAFYNSHMQRQDMVRLLGEQQFSTVSLLANVIENQLVERFRALEAVANAMTPDVLVDRGALQGVLEHRRIFNHLFNAGSFVIGSDGIAIASFPVEMERIGVDYGDIEYIATALKDGKAVISRPVLGKKSQAPLFGMAQPIRDARGNVIGLLVGVTDLSKPNFLENITESHYGASGNYLIAAPRHNLFVTASDKTRLMRPLPAPGINPLHDRYASGHDGYGLLVNFRGEEELSAARHIPTAEWFLGLAVPTGQAFAPIDAMQSRMLLAAVLLTLLAGALMWLVLRHHLSPMFDAVKSLAMLTDSGQPPPALPINRPDEVGQLLRAVNRLLDTLRQRQEALILSEARFRCLTEMSSDFYWETDVDHRFTQRTENNLVDGHSLLSPLLVLGMCRWEIPSLTPDEAGWLAHRRVLDAHLPFRDVEISRVGAHGAVYHVSVSGDPMFNDAGHFIGYRGIGTDITVRKQADAELRIAACAFESQESMMITDEKGIILRVNQAFTASTGYEAGEVVGRSPQLLRSGRHSEAFYRNLWEQLHRTGSWQGEVWDRRKNGQIYPKWLNISAVKAENGTVTHYVGTHTDISERKDAQDKIALLAFSDTLTGLPNRILFQDRLQQALATSRRSGSHGALILLDLDNFKALNDTLGHDQGDLLLQQVAQRLLACMRAGDTVARLGGDEFVVMLEGLANDFKGAASDAEMLGEQIRAALNEPYQLAGYENRSTPSIGIAVFSGQHNSGQELLKQADLAMYRAKTAGRNTLRIFEPEMQVTATNRTRLEQDLHDALRLQQFILHYQPQVVHDGQITGAEALVRWQHPQRGLVPPAEFIAVAEETGLILPLGLWVMQTVCTQLARWSAWPELANLAVAVNVSAHQFHQPDFVERVLAIVQSTGADPRRLKLELTESLLVSNLDAVIAKMVALKSKGIGFSLDDFGTGFSSLTYLKRFLLEQLKIDQSFVRDVLTDPNDAAIAKTIIVLAQRLNLSVIAEGVESAAQRDFLNDAGCHGYQGYFFSQPMPVDDFENFVVARCVAPDHDDGVQH